MEGIQALYLAGKFEQVLPPPPYISPLLTAPVRTVKLHSRTSRRLL
jgi:hypothetical protein